VREKRRGGVSSSFRNLFIIVAIRCKGDVPMMVERFSTDFKKERATGGGDQEAACGRHAQGMGVERNEEWYRKRNAPITHNTSLSAPSHEHDKLILVFVRKPASDGNNIYYLTVLHKTRWRRFCSDV
jgi:hypothetical protein